MKNRWKQHPQRKSNKKPKSTKSPAISVHNAQITLLHNRTTTKTAVVTNVEENMTPIHAQLKERPVTTAANKTILPKYVSNPPGSNKGRESNLSTRTSRMTRIVAAPYGLSNKPNPP